MYSHHADGDDSYRTYETGRNRRVKSAVRLLTVAVSGLLFTFAWVLWTSQSIWQQVAALILVIIGLLMVWAAFTPDDDDWHWDPVDDLGNPLTDDTPDSNTHSGN